LLQQFRNEITNILQIINNCIDKEKTLQEQDLALEESARKIISITKTLKLDTLFSGFNTGNQLNKNQYEDIILFIVRNVSQVDKDGLNCNILLKMLISKNTNLLNFKDGDNWTLLHHAIDCNAFHVGKILLKNFEKELDNDEMLNIIMAQSSEGDGRRSILHMLAEKKQKQVVNTDEIKLFVNKLMELFKCHTESKCDQLNLDYKKELFINLKNSADETAKDMGLVLSN
jgi:hypothetical protein